MNIGTPAAPSPRNPYQALPTRQFWRPAVADRTYDQVSELWTPKFEIGDRTRFSTYGSCFAQHFGRALRSRGYRWLIAETAPEYFTEEDAARFNFGVFTSRTGNIYTTSLLRQWVSWASGEATPPDEVWLDDGRYYDPFRPAIEPDGFADVDELHRTREATIKAFAASIKRADIFVFTLGLTESWVNAQTGVEYPMCPGTHAGTFNADEHVFVNQDYPTVEANLSAALDMMRKMNPSLKFLLTVSPVPLTATNAGEHVIVATMYSKSVLRAVAGTIAKTMPDVDYFPSYEIINAPTFGGRFFTENQRNIRPEGVEFVMNHFFSGVNGDEAAPAPAERTGRAGKGKRKKADEVCEEALLEAFGPKG